MQSFIKIAAESFDKQQDRKVLQGEQRTYRILECWKGDQVRTFFAKIQKLLSEPQVAIPSCAFTESSRTLIFRMLARAGSVVEQVVAHQHRGCPFTLFAALIGCVHEVLSVDPCMQDELTQKFLSVYGEQGLNSEEAQNSLAALARIIEIDILAIEAKHSSTRRLVVLKSTQTWPIHMQNLSAEWTIRQHKIGRASFDVGHSNLKQKNKIHRKRTWRKVSTRQGGGGPWRAFIRHKFSGHAGKPSKSEIRQATEEYRLIKHNGGPEWDNLVNLGSLATVAHRHGHKAFFRGFVAKRKAAECQIVLSPIESLESQWKVARRTCMQDSAIARKQEQQRSIQDAVQMRQNAESSISPNLLGSSNNFESSLATLPGNTFRPATTLVHVPGDTVAKDSGLWKGQVVVGR